LKNLPEKKKEKRNLIRTVRTIIHQAKIQNKQSSFPEKTKQTHNITSVFCKIIHDFHGYTDLL